MGVFRLLPLNANLQTNDGDTSFEAFAQGVPRDFSLQSPTGIVPSDGVISQVVVGWKAKDPQANGDIMRAGIESGGVRQFGTSQVLDASGYQPLVGEFEDIFTVDALDGLPWTFAKLQVARFTAIADTVFGSPDPRITFAYVDVHAVTPPAARVSADASSESPGGVPSSSSPSAEGTVGSPKGDAS